MARQAWAKAQDEYVHSRALATSHISSRAVALGYASGISVLIALLVPVTIARGSTTALRFAIAGSGLCWALGSIREHLNIPTSAFLFYQLTNLFKLPSSGFGPRRAKKRRHAVAASAHFSQLLDRAGSDSAA